MQMFFLSFIDESNRKSTNIKDRGGNITKKTPRPKNAFILYRGEKQKSFNANFKKLHSKELSRIIGKMWRNESEEVIRIYERLAEEEKLKHISKYPLYKYSPRQKKKVKCTQNTTSYSTETGKSNDKTKLADESTQANVYDILNEDDVLDWAYADVSEKVPSNSVNTESKETMENGVKNGPSYNETATMLFSSTLPSDLVEEIHILPDTSNLDLFALDDFEYENLLNNNCNEINM